jgi:aryl-alcohol dehydrogenase-like predicted oxidoreductase
MNIVLGAAQFGMSYGVSNVEGQTAGHEVEKILKYAYSKNINMIDTAPSYGISEDVIGRTIHCDNNNWNVITKTPIFKSNSIGDKQINQIVENFKLSLKRLGKKSIYSLLVHDCNNLFLPGGERILVALNQLKEDGFIKKTGVSLYTSNQIDKLLDNYLIDIIQLPINILDQRLIENGQLKNLNKNGIEIHARSVFLQGLLLMPIENIPRWFKPILDKLEYFHKEASERNMSPLQLALGFVQSIHDIDSVIVGINTLDHMHEITNTVSMYFNPAEFSNLSISNPTYLNPSNWKI